MQVFVRNLAYPPAEFRPGLTSAEGGSEQAGDRDAHGAGQLHGTGALCHLWSCKNTALKLTKFGMLPLLRPDVQASPTCNMLMACACQALPVTAWQQTGCVVNNNTRTKHALPVLQSFACTTTSTCASAGFATNAVA